VQNFFTVLFEQAGKKNLESIERRLCQPDICILSFAFLIHDRFIRPVVIGGEK